MAKETLAGTKRELAAEVQKGLDLMRERDRQEMLKDRAERATREVAVQKDQVLRELDAYRRLAHQMYGFIRGHHMTQKVVPSALYAGSLGPENQETIDVWPFKEDMQSLVNENG